MSEFSSQSPSIELLGTHPAFQELAAFQTIYNHHFFPDEQAATQAAISALGEINHAIDRDGIFGQPAALSGTDIQYPALAANDEGGALISTRTLDCGNDPFCERGPVNGMFFGFSPVISKVGEQYKITFQNRVATHEQTVFGPVSGTLCAYGSIDTTNLEFLADRQKLDAQAALARLAELSIDEESAFTVELIDELLTPSTSEAPYDIVHLRQVGEVLRQYEMSRGASDQRYRDSIIDLISARLGIYGSDILGITAESALIRQGDRTLMTSNGVEGTYSVDSLGFVPYFQLFNDIPVTRTDSGDMLSLITSEVGRPNAGNSPQQIFFIPLEKLHSIKLQS